jgi:hypothetical protein
MKVFSSVSELLMDNLAASIFGEGVVVSIRQGRAKREQEKTNMMIIEAITMDVLRVFISNLLGLLKNFLCTHQSVETMITKEAFIKRLMRRLLIEVLRIMMK